MINIKEYKCNFKHCNCDEALTEENREVENGKSYHKKCLQTKRDIVEIRDYYIENVSKTVVVGVLVKVINSIIFDKQVDSQYLKFTLKYANINNFNIKAPFSLHYLVDNSKIKDAWNKSQTNTSKETKEYKKSSEITDDFDFGSDVIAMPKISIKGGFGDILRRK